MAYWKTCVEESLADVGISATIEQIDAIARDMQMAREMESQACGYEHIQDPRVQEISVLTKLLRDEERMVTCRTCNGTGTYTTYGGTMMSTSSCHKCNGRGRHL